MQARSVSMTWAAGAALTVGLALPGPAFAQYRPIDGVGNNETNTEWGAVDTQLLRAAPSEYADGVSAPAGADRPNARVISNSCADQGRTPIWSRHALSTMAIFWGQFVDHDIDLTEPPVDAFEPMMIPVPTDDPFFNPAQVPMIPFLRSRYDHDTGTGPDNPRQQINEITAFIDASTVYGHTHERALVLRTYSDGKLIMTAKGMLPGATLGVEMANPTGDALERLFSAGDVRANENPGLAVLHTVFAREHNRRCDELKALHPDWTDEQLYQEARLWVGSLVQAITYNEFLPAFLGYDAIPEYAGYDPGVNPGIANEFAHAAYRVGHSMINPQLPRYDVSGVVFDTGPLDLLSSFFVTDALRLPGGLDAVIRGMVRQASQEVDMQVVDDLRNFLFGAGSGGLDLAAVNIQRGRDHGLASYNAYRVAYGLPSITDFGQAVSNPQAAQDLRDLYGTPDNADLWVAGLAEDHVPGSSFGPTFRAIIADQFVRLRDGDRFWYERVHDAATVAELNSTTLSDVLERNTDAGNLPPNAFHISVDFDENSRLNLDDLSMFVDAYQQGSLRADLNGDGILNLDDVEIFVDAYLTIVL